MKRCLFIAALCLVLNTWSSTDAFAHPIRVPYPVLKPKFNLVAPNAGGDPKVNIPRAVHDPSELGHLSPNVIPPTPKPYAVTPSLKSRCPTNISLPPSFVEPASLHPTNNLRRKNGEYFTASGHYIEFHGVVRDRNCVPVKNARIHIWQRDNNGGHQAEYNAVVEDVRLHPDYDKYFGYSGITQTDNRGEFSFISIMPGTDHPAEPPHLNIKISHDFFNTLVTRVYMLPNRQFGNMMYDISPSNPFRLSDIPTLAHPPGETASSDVINGPDKRHGFRFFTNFSLVGNNSFREF